MHAYQFNSVERSAVLLSKLVLTAIVGFGVSYASCVVGVPVIFVILGGISIWALSFLKPVVGIVAIFLFEASVIPEGILTLPILPRLSLHYADVILLVLIMKAMMQVVTGKIHILWGRLYATSFALFMFSIILSAIFSIAYLGLDFNLVIRQFRVMFYYTLVIIIPILINDRMQVKILTMSLLTLAIITAGLMIAQSMVHNSLIFLPGRVETVQTFSQTYTATRVLPPGQTLLFAACIYALVYSTVRKGQSVMQYGVLLLLMGGLILTYNRNYWISLMIVGAIAMIRKEVPIPRVVLIISSLALVWLAIYWSSIIFGIPTMGEFVAAIRDRFFSFFMQQKVMSSGSMQWRFIETEAAFQKILQSPFLGNGLNNKYYGISSSWIGAQSYIHNGYLWLLLNIGGIGFFSYLFMYFRFILNAVRKVGKIPDIYLRTTVIGCYQTGIGLLLCAFVNPVMGQSFSIVVIATVIAISEVTAQIGIREQNG